MDRLGLFRAARTHFPAAAADTAGTAGRKATRYHAPTGHASPYDLEPTDPPGAGMIGLRRIAEIRRSMRRNGYDGPPVAVVTHEGRKYVVNGNHRLRASEGILDEIPYREVELPFLGYRTIDDVLEDWNMCWRMLPDWMASRTARGAGGRSPA